MQNNTQTEIKVLLTQLLGQPVDSSTFEYFFEQLKNHSNPEIMLDHLQSLLSWEDDPEWLEAIAAARDGFMMTEVEEFLEERDALITIAPELVAQFDALLAIPAPDEHDLLPNFPTFAMQFEMERKKRPNWIQALGFQWQCIQESGKVVIQLLNQALGRSQGTSIATNSTPIAVKGHISGSKESHILHRIKLEPDQTGEMDIEAVIRREENDSEACTVTIRALIPSQWEWAGTVVKASAGDWQAEGATDDEGGVILKGMPESELERLRIEVNP